MLSSSLRTAGRLMLPTRTYSNVATASSAKLQEQALEEKCILVNERDQYTGSASKRDCHRVDPEGNIRLHRAFSVFLFNSAGDMLLQRRSVEKITFPDCYTNACCSHPLYDIEGEREELNALGIRRAAQRRLNYELGIPMAQARPENFHYITRIHYADRGDGTWGEHEIDYILFLQKDVDLKPNDSEILSEATKLDFVGGKSTTNQLFTLRQILSKCREYQIATHHLFINYKVALRYHEWTKIWHILSEIVEHAVGIVRNSPDSEEKRLDLFNSLASLMTSRGVH